MVLWGYYWGMQSGFNAFLCIGTERVASLSRRNQSSSACSIAAHFCKNRKDMAPSVGMAHANIIKPGAPANLRLRDNVESLLPLWVFLAASAALSWTVWLWPIDHRLVIVTNFYGWRVTWPLYTQKIVIGNALPGLLALICRRAGKTATP